MSQARGGLVVTDFDGLRGTIEAVPEKLNRSSQNQVVVRFENGQRVSVPAYAQDNNAPAGQDNRTTTTRTETRREENRQEERRDWGWLGLLGLGRLLGLMPRKRVPVVYQATEQRDVNQSVPVTGRR